MAKFLEALKAGSLVVDGAMGTQLYERGVLYNACFEELCLSKPELVTRIHEDYVRAGAQVLETNTFGANAMRLEKHGLVSKMAEINHAAVRLAREASGGKAFVVGAIGPSGYFLGDALPEESREGPEGARGTSARAGRRRCGRAPRRDRSPDERAPRRRRERR